MTIKIKWKVGEAPTGRYRSFQSRSWPSAYYKDEGQNVCAFIYCEDSYSAYLVKSGHHKPLTVRIADHSVNPWKWRALKSKFSSLGDAKKAVDNCLKQHPHFIPTPRNDEPSQ